MKFILNDPQLDAIWVIVPLLRITVYCSHVSFWEGQALTESRMTWFSKSLLNFLSLLKLTILYEKACCTRDI